MNVEHTKTVITYDTTNIPYQAF